VIYLLVLSNNHPLKNSLIFLLKFIKLNRLKKDSFSVMKPIPLLKTEEARANQVYLSGISAHRPGEH